jgi:hypothetical protein
MHMKRMKKVLMTMGLVGVLAGAAHADAWTFGVISDTQQTVSGGENSVATPIIAAVNQQFIAAGVDLVVAVGDLGDNGSNASMTSRAAANANLTAAGISFYPLQGNHDVSATNFNTAFPNLPGTPGGGGSSPAGMAGLTYSFVHNDTKFMLFQYGTNMASSSVKSWMSSELSAADHEQAFVFTHADLLGQNHKDNIFGSGNDSDPTTQNFFFNTLATNDVKYVISGHDHMDHRSIVTSPDGQNKVQEIITQSDSTKWYTATSGFSTREQSVSDQQNMIGYYLFTVDGPKVTGQYFATPIVNNTVGSNPVWTLQDTFGYSLNGRQFTIARGATYTNVIDQIAAGAGFRGTSMRILNGTNSLTGTAEGSRAEVDDLNTGWSPRVDGLASDVLTLWGMNNALGSKVTDAYALSMNFATSEGVEADDIFLATPDANGNWINAFNGNTGGTPNFVLGAYDPSYGLGTYGIDLSNSTAWAVVNYAGDFSVVPEPATLTLLGLGGLSFLLRRRRAK